MQWKQHLSSLGFGGLEYLLVHVHISISKGCALVLNSGKIELCCFWIGYLYKIPTIFYSSANQSGFKCQKLQSRKDYGLTLPNASHSNCYTCTMILYHFRSHTGL